MKTIMGFAIPQDTTSALIESTGLVLKLQEENARLRTALKKLWLAAPSEVQCHNMHHPKPKQHRYDETCELVSDYLEAIVDAQEALKGQP